MQRDQWERYRRAGELPVIHTRSVRSSVSVVAALALGAWLVIEPPAVQHELTQNALHVTLPRVVVVGKRDSPEPIMTAHSRELQPDVNIVAKDSLP